MASSPSHEPSPELPEDSGPTARRIVLGAHLRRLRERAGIGRPDAAWSMQPWAAN